MPIHRPTWFAGRQGKIEEVAPELVKLSGPNLNEGYIGIRKDDTGRYSAFVRASADGPDLKTSSPVYPNLYEAWEAAFELFRNQFII